MGNVVVAFDALDWVEAVTQNGVKPLQLGRLDAEVRDRRAAGRWVSKHVDARYSCGEGVQTGQRTPNVATERGGAAVAEAFRHERVAVPRRRGEAVGGESPSEFRHVGGDGDVQAVHYQISERERYRRCGTVAASDVVEEVGDDEDDDENPDDGAEAAEGELQDIEDDVDGNPDDDEHEDNLQQVLYVHTGSVGEHTVDCVRCAQKRCGRHEAKPLCHRVTDQRSMRGTLAVAVAVVCCLAVAVGAGVGAAAHEEPDRNVIGVELHADGDASVHHVSSYDLDDEQERRLYEGFAENETARQQWRDEVVAQFRSMAENGSSASGRDMRVHNVSVETYEMDGEGYGRLEVHVTWENFAYAESGRVIVAEPFRSSYDAFEQDRRRVAMHGPDGYLRGQLDPSPLRVQRNSALWNPGTSNFSRFYAEFTDPSTETPADGTAETTAAPSEQPSGFGTAARALLVALVPVAVALLAIRRRQD